MAASLKPDEVISFFPTFGYRANVGDLWVLPIHAWVYEPELESLLRRGAIRLLRRALKLDETTAANSHFQRRARAFLVDNERGKSVSIRIGDRQYQLAGRTSRNGHLRALIQLPEAQIAPLRSADGWLPYEAIVDASDQRLFRGRLQLVPPTGLSVISDIDDTIKFTQVGDRRAVLNNTFLHDYQAVVGMAELYRSWAAQGVTFHYVSSSPWHLFPFLEELFIQAEIPLGSFHLKNFRWRDRTFFDLFASPQKTKPKAILPILEVLPRRRFLLVGDSGEKDPEVYGDLARSHPMQVAGICIRNVTDEDEDTPRFQQAFAGIPRHRWCVFQDPRELAELSLDGLMTLE